MLQVTELLDHFRGDDLHATGEGQDINQLDEGLFQHELHRIAIHHLHPRATARALLVAHLLDPQSLL